MDGSPRHWKTLVYLTEHYSIWFCHNIVYHSKILNSIWQVGNQRMITSKNQHLEPPFPTWKSHITQDKGWKFWSPRLDVSVILASWLSSGETPAISTNLENQEHSSQSHQHQNWGTRVFQQHGFSFKKSEAYLGAKVSHNELPFEVKLRILLPRIANCKCQ